MRIRHKHYLLPEVHANTDLFATVSSPPISSSLVVEAPSVSVDTSREAAAKITKHTARIREAIWLWLKTQGAHGATAGEICAALGLSGSTVRPRLIELRGEAKWTKGLPRRISRTALRRSGMRIYEVLVRDLKG